MRQISMIAAATAFWFFLSLVPIVILAASILPYTPLSEAQLMGFIEPLVPASVYELIGVIVADVYKSSLAVLSISILVTVWSAARGFTSLVRGLEEVYEQREGTGYFLRRARGIAYTLAMLVFMLLLIVLGGFGQQLMRLAERFLPALHGVFAFMLHFRFIVVIALLTVFFSAIFVWGSGKKLPYRSTIPGALLSAIGWSVLTWGFSAWIAGSYGTYGSLATVIVVMLWLYFCQYVLLLGACLNRAVELGINPLRRRKEKEC